MALVSRQQSGGLLHGDFKIQFCTQTLKVSSIPIRLRSPLNADL